MTAPIETSEPELFYAGDTLKFRITVPGYSAPTWTLEYTLVREGEQITFSSSSDAGAHLISELAATTATWGAGTYNYIGRVTSGAESYQVRVGQIEIRANFAAETSGLDARSHVKKTLDALEATLFGKASKDQLSYTINGRSISRLSASELREWHSHYTGLYRAERDAERVARGEKSKSKIRVRFN